MLVALGSLAFAADIRPPNDPLSPAEDGFDPRPSFVLIVA